MKHRNRLLSTAVFASLAATNAFAATDRPPQVQVHAEYRRHYDAGSDGARNVQQWLLAHAAYERGRSIGDPAALGALMVAFSGAASRANAVGGSPSMLPSRGDDGDDGDTIAVSSCNGPPQRWNYTWEGGTDGGWVLSGYVRRLVPPCGADNR